MVYLRGTVPEVRPNNPPKLAVRPVMPLRAQGPRQAIPQLSGNVRPQGEKLCEIEHARPEELLHEF